MRNRALVFFILSVSLMMAASCGSGGGGTKVSFPSTTTGTNTSTDTGTSSGETINFENYFWPLNEDWKWTFTNNEYQQIETTVSVGSHSTVYPMSWVDGGGPVEKWYFATDGGGTLIEVRYAHVDNYYYDYDVPLVWGKKSMEKDVTISTTATGTEYDYMTTAPTGSSIEFKLDVTYLGKETVTVPAGTFNNCIKVKYDHYYDGSLDLEEIYWFSWGDGIVKNEVVGSRTLEVLDIQYPY